MDIRAQYVDDTSAVVDVAWGTHTEALDAAACCRTHIDQSDSEHYIQGASEHYIKGEGEHYIQGDSEHYIKGEGEHYILFDCANLKSFPMGGELDGTGCDTPCNFLSCATRNFSDCLLTTTLEPNSCSCQVDTDMLTTADEVVPVENITAIELGLKSVDAEIGRDNGWLLRRKLRVYNWESAKIVISGRDVIRYIEDGCTLRVIAEMVQARWGLPLNEQLIKIRGETKYLNQPDTNYFPVLTRQLVHRMMLYVDSSLEVCTNENGPRRRRVPADLIHDTPVAVLNLVVSGDNSLIRDPSCAALLCWDAQLGATCTYDVLHRLRKKKCKWLRSKIQHLLPAGAVSQCIVRGLKAKTRYEFRVRSKSGDSSGPYSQVVYHKTAAPIQLQNRTNMHHRSNESVPQTKTATLSPQEATIISAESLEVKPVKKKRKIEQNQSTIQESANIHIFKNDEVELETTILKNDEVALETAINAATDLSRGVALCLFCGEIADALFSCGHLTSCQQCCSVKIQLHDSRCCICFNTVDSISLLELKKGNSVACALRLKGCSHMREVALPCGCYKYCDNCASSMIMCVEHKRRLVPGESIKVFDQAGFIRAD